MEIINEETGLNDKTYEIQLKKVRHLRIPEKSDIFLRKIGFILLPSSYLFSLCVSFI